MEQRPPYPPLTQATAHEPVTTLEHVTGTLAGFRTPAYEQGISVAGYHLHYLTDDRRRGHGRTNQTDGRRLNRREISRIGRCR